jgi:tRNA G18 (ribose-2'-O)-methylase SpoU
VLLTEAQHETLAPELSNDVDVFIATSEQLHTLTGFNFHRGCLACGERQRRTPVRIADLATSPRSMTVLLDAVSDPSNLGAIVRNCRALGVSLLVLGPGCADPFSRRAIRVSMGNVFTLTLAFSDALEQTVTELKQTLGATLYGAVLDVQATPLAQLRAAPHSALLLGSEHDGLAHNLRAMCDRKVVVPMAEGADSLNVAAASAVILYGLMQGE